MNINYFGKKMFVYYKNNVICWKIMLFEDNNGIVIVMLCYQGMWLRCLVGCGR